MDPVAIVMGGTSAVGRRVVERLVEAGTLVAVLDSDPDGVAKLEGELDGDLTLAFAVDPTDPDDISEALDAVVERFGAPTILVDVGAVEADTAFLDTGVEALNGVVERSIFGRLALAFLVADAMEEGGAIVLVLAAPPQRAAATAVDGALRGFVRGAAAELARANLRVNAVAAGPIEGSLGALATRAALARVPQGRLPSPDAVVASVLFLLSEEAGSITGQILAVDGGASAGA